MRIDYSDPKKSCSSSQSGQSRPRKESTGGALIVSVVSCVVCLGIGFGSGWMLSQRSAKKGFKAAMAQQSLENSPQQATVQPPQQQPAAPAPIPSTMPQGQTGGSASQPVTNSGVPAVAETPLSFYKTLPSGQKSNVMGSGLNTKDEKTSKQPLQAAMPANMARPTMPRDDEGDQKQPASVLPVKPVAAIRADASGLTVQVASYSLKSEAEAMRSKLAAKGYSVNIVESHLGDKGTWYRVRVGKRLDADAAKELAGKLGKGAIAIPDKD